MKKLIIPILLLASLGFSESKPKNEVIILQAEQTFVSTPDGYGYTGEEVYCASASSGAPTYQLPFYYHDKPATHGANFAQSVADALDAGYTLEKITENSAILVKHAH